MKKQAYSLAQQVDERMDRLNAEDGWSKVFLPEIQKTRDLAQEAINNLATSPRVADQQRGVLLTCDLVLSYIEDKKSTAAHNMAGNINPL